MMNLGELVQQARGLLDSGVLRKADESTVSQLVNRFDRTSNLVEGEIRILRKIVEDNS